MCILYRVSYKKNHSINHTKIPHTYFPTQNLYFILPFATLSTISSGSFVSSLMLFHYKKYTNKVNGLYPEVDSTL